MRVCTQTHTHTHTHIYTIYTHLDPYLAPDYTALFVLHCIYAIHLEGKTNKMHLGMYQVINWPYHWAERGDFPDVLYFHYHHFALI